MRWSSCYIPTLKEAPADAEVISHQLLIRAGMIRKLTAGVYSYLPLGLRSIAKVSGIVREEMSRAGSNEVLLPAVQPADLWQESRRWEQYGKELLRFQDRNGRDCCLGPTHEEVITDLVRGEVRSYRQLPVSLYQIQTKFRDEMRPRFGLMRGREFIMKDAYTFDRDDQGADASYKIMYDAYRRIFDRLALHYRAVEADSGSIGGKFSHEFTVLANTGEDTIVACSSCEYAANIERAEVAPPTSRDQTSPPAYEQVLTPDCHSVAEVAQFLKIEPSLVIKTLLLDVDGQPLAVLLRGDHELNEIKVKNHLKADKVRLATPEETILWTGAPIGFAGPIALVGIPVIADNTLRERDGWVTGANSADAHFINVSLERDVDVREYTDIRCITPGEACPRCGGVVETMRGIEVGHVFKLGLKYSEAMKAMFLDEKGKEQYLVMGCYGIGVSRVVAACIEQNHDANGIQFPPPITPYEVMLVNLDVKSAQATAKADELYAYFAGLGLDAFMDDRDERPGVKFKDADLLGFPMQIIVGGKGLARGVIEATDRRTREKTELPVEGFAEAFVAWKKHVYQGWGMD